MDDAHEQQGCENDMIRCNPSQIRLTTSDVVDVDRRMANRQRASTDINKGKARLSIAPRLPQIITDGDFLFHHASTATLHVSASPEKDASERQPPSLPDHERSTPRLQAHLSQGNDLATAHEEPTKIDPLKLSPSSAPRLAVPRLEISHHRYLRHRRRQTSPSHHRIPNSDGAHDHDPITLQEPGSESRRPVPIHAGREVFRELPGSDSNARSPHASTHETWAQPHRPSPTTTLRATTEVERANAPTVAILDDRIGGPGHTFDPGAAPFTPRVRFGSTTVHPSTEQSESDSTQSNFSPALRIQSPSDQNSNTSREGRSQARPEHSQVQTRTSTLSPGSHVRRVRSNAISSRSRRSSPNLDRYPLLLPISSGTSTGRNAFDRGSRVSSREHYTSHLSPQQPQHLNDQITAPAIDAITSSTHASPPFLSSPIVSSSSHSSPDINRPRPSPVIHGRSSSLLWHENSPQPSASSRVPSIVSAASGISITNAPDCRTSTQRCSPNAAEEFLKCRSSPLDGLTAELSRLSTALSSREVRVDAKCHSPSSTRRVRLLSGTLSDGNGAIHENFHEPRNELALDTSAIAFTDDREASSMGLLASPSRMNIPRTPAAPITPDARLNTPAIQRLSHLTKAQPHAATIETTTPAPKPAVTATPTPKVTIYNDATPAHLQPQTPADLHRSSRRTRNRSDSSIHREAFCVGPILVAHRPAIPERKAYRNTYPTNIPRRVNHGIPNNESMTTSSSMHAGLSAEVTIRTDISTTGSEITNSDERENELEAHLTRLESERDTWSRRRQGGSLDVTPPREGRFERFLD